MLQVEMGTLRQHVKLMARLQLPRQLPVLWTHHLLLILLSQFLLLLIRLIRSNLRLNQYLQNHGKAINEFKVIHLSSIDYEKHLEVQTYFLGYFF